MRGDISFTWFRLFSTRGYGPVRVGNLINRAVLNGLKISDIFDLDRAEFVKIFAPQGEEIYDTIHGQDLNDIASEYYRLISEGVEIIHRDHPLYPVRMKTLFLEQAPSMLFAQGNLSLLDCPGVSIVGSREVDEKGLELALQSAQAAAKTGFNVVSGYARGVDSAAHLGALKSGGTTTMVLAYGLDHFRPRSIIAEYPWENDSLRVSQFHPRDPWKNSHGMIRNKVIAAFSKAVIVITAGEKSGTLNTGNAALKSGIPLLVMSPGLFRQPPAGNVDLIEKGAVEIASLESLTNKLNQLLALNQDTVAAAPGDKQGMLPL